MPLEHMPRPTLGTPMCLAGPRFKVPSTLLCQSQGTIHSHSHGKRPQLPSGAANSIAPQCPYRFQ